MSYVNALAIFAERYSLTAQEAFVLPALMEKAAAECGLTIGQMVEAATWNEAAGRYLKGVAQEVVSKL